MRRSTRSTSSCTRSSTSRRPSPTSWCTCRRRWTCCIERIARRGVDYEQHIDRQYLERLNEAYARFFHEYEAAPLLIVNAASIDPIANQRDYDELLAAIQRMTPRAPVLQPVAQPRDLATLEPMPMYKHLQRMPAGRR